VVSVCKEQIWALLEFVSQYSNRDNDERQSALGIKKGLYRNLYYFPTRSSITYRQFCQNAILCDVLRRGYSSPLNATENEPQAVATLLKNNFSLSHLKTYHPFTTLFSLISHILILIPKQVIYIIY